MLEHVARVLYYLQIHLLYASLVAFAAWGLTAIPRASATTKYWIWVATSLNFIVPLGAFVDRVWGAQLYWASPLGVIGEIANTIPRSPAAGVLAILWVLGASVMFTRLYLRLRSERRQLQGINGDSSHSECHTFVAHGIPVRFAESRQTPAVDGVLRPHISLPSGIDQLLTGDELQAVLIHELTHARRRDNLIRLIHELGSCLLWFHPLVWITGSRLSLYRELSCDESVIQNAHGGDLVSALVKLSSPDGEFLLQASASSSFIKHRLAHLARETPRVAYLGVNTALTMCFGAVMIGGVLGTVAHTACCFRH